MLISALAFVLVALIAGNNLAVPVGALISGRIVRLRTGIIIALIGYVAGLLAQGSFLNFGFSVLMPFQTYTLITIALSVSILMFIATYLLKVMNSFGVTFSTALLGVSIAAGEAMQAGYVAMMILFWIFAPILSMLIADWTIRLTRRKFERMHVWKVLSTVRLVLILLCFFTAFTIGANTLGLVYASVRQYTSILVVLAATVVGAVLLSREVLNKVGDTLIPLRYLNALIAQSISAAFAEIATLSSVPLANTQAYTAGLIGAGLGYKTRLLIRKRILKIVAVWITTASFSFVIGYFVTYLVLGFA